MNDIFFVGVRHEEDSVGACFSGTGALAGSDEVWDALLEQEGALGVFDMDELVDMMVTFSYLTPPLGKRLAVVCGGGGSSAVMATDQYASDGFRARDPKVVGSNPTPANNFRS